MGRHGMLAEQWQDELWQKFQLDFKILTQEGLESARTGNWLAENDRVSRRQLVQEFLDRGLAEDPSQAGHYIPVISVQIGKAKNDYLRQVIGYSYPKYPWQKNDYHIRDGYRELVQSVLAEAAEAVGE